MAEYLTNTTDLTKVATAIREKGGTSDPLVYPDGFVVAIQAIQTGTELQIIVSVTSGATDTATKGSLSVSGTSVNGTCTLTVPEAGTWIVSASLNGQTSNTENVSTEDSYPVELTLSDENPTDTKEVSVRDSYAVALTIPTLPVSTNLNDNTWDVIKTVSESNKGENYWSVGDCKTVEVNGSIGTLQISFTQNAFIVGFNHDDISGIHFQFGKTNPQDDNGMCLCEANYNTSVTTSGSYNMINSSTNNYSEGWYSSQMRFKIMEDYLAALPQELRSVIREVRHTEDGARRISGNVRWATYSGIPSKLFLLSESEVFGVKKYAHGSYSTQYPYYSAGNSKIKYGFNGNNIGAVHWWLRSAAGLNNCVYVDENGNAGSKNARYSYGIAPAFVV